MIHFRATASLSRAGGIPRLLLAPFDLDLPTDRAVAILGGRADARLALLHLVAGRRRPDAGIVLHRCRVSPVLNDERVLHPTLTGLANLGFIARTHGVTQAALIRAVDAFSGLAAQLTEPVRSLDGGSRRILEAAIVAALPCDLILLDDAQQYPLPALVALRDAARAKGAGLLFSSAGPRPAQTAADLALVLDGDRPTLQTDPRAAAARLERAAA